MIKFLVCLIVIIFLLVLSVAFGASNDQVVVFNYLIAKTELTLSTLAAVLVGSGFVLGWLLTGIFYLKVKFQLKSVQRKLQKLQKLQKK